MTSYYDPTRSCVLQVNISHLIYPVTEKVLGQLFDVYGVNDVCLLQQSTYIEAFVEFQSWYEATEARSALHGRCIYDGCCLLDIQHAPLSISVMRLPNSEPVVVDWDQVEVAPPVPLSNPSASTPAAPIAVFTSTAISEESPEVHPARTGPIVDKALDCELLVDLSAPHKASAPAMTDVKEARASDDVFTASTGCTIMAPTSCLTLCLHDNGNKRITDQVPVLGPAACPPPSLDRRLYASLMPCPLPWPSFDGDGKQLTSTCPATQGTWPYFQPKPPWVYSVQALFSEGPKCWAHLYISGNLHLVEICWNFSSPELPLYWNDWFMGYNVTDLVAQKNRDPGGMLQSGCAPLAFPRCFCMSWDPCSTEAKHHMEQLSLNKFGLVCKATCTVTHQLDPEILVGSFHVHSVGTLKFVMVRQYFWKVQFIDYLPSRDKEWVQDLQCVQPISVVYHAPAVWREQHIAGTQFQVLVNASVLKLQAIELWMGDVSATFRARLLRTPYPPPVPEVLGNHTKWVAGGLKHMPGIVHRICSRNGLMEKCYITCMLQCGSSMSSDKRQGEQFTCSAGKSVEVQCCIFSPGIMMEPRQCTSINVMPFVCYNIWWILEVTPWTNDSDIAELTCCTPGCSMFIGIALTRIVWSVAQLLSYHVEGVHADCHMVKSSKYKMQEQQKRGGTGHSFFPHPWLPNIILVAAQEKSSHSWEDAQGMQTHLFLTQQLGTLSCFVTTQTCELMRVDLTDKYTKHSVQDIVLILTHEQNASLFVVLDARVQWDPGRLWSTMSGEHKTNAERLVEELHTRLPLSIRHYTALLYGWCRQGKLDEAKHVLARMKTAEVAPDVVVFNTLLAGFVADGRFEDAFELAKEMERRDCPPNAVSYTTLMQGLGSRGRVDEVMRVFVEMRRKGCAPDSVTYGTLVGAFCKAGRLAQGYEFLDAMSRDALRVDPAVYLGFFVAHEKKEQLEECPELMERMRECKCPPNLSIYNVVIRLSCKLGETKQAVTLWNEMENSGLSPGVDTFAIMVNGLVGQGSLVDACNYFKDMVGRGLFVAPQYGVLKDLLNALVRDEKLELAKDVWGCILSKGCELNVSAWTIWIHALYAKKHVKEACSYCLDMLEAGLMPQPDTFAKLMKGLKKLYNRQIAAEITEKVRLMAEERHVSFKMYKRRGVRDIEEKPKSKKRREKKRSSGRQTVQDQSREHADLSDFVDDEEFSS